MKEETSTLVKYRVQRARESLEEAKILEERGHANTFVNRLYYACFYAVSALLLTRELASSKHSGIRSLFHQHFVKTGKIEQEFAQLYDRLFDNRQKADYADLINFDIKEVSSWYEEAEQFIAAIETILNRELNDNNSTKEA